MTGEKFAERLLDANNEKEVQSILNNLIEEWEPTWKSHGPEQNYSIVYNQAPDPIASLAEPLINSIDAVLMKRYQEQYGLDTYDSKHNLITAHQAVEELYDEDITDEIELIADGDGDSPNLTIRDTGKGQPPELFEDRFLNLAAGGQFKEEWPFVQGRFKMGGSAVLRWSGKHGYKFILSSSHRNPGEWSWSIIRNNRAEATYEYLTLDGEIPTFSGEVRGQEYGTFVKMYDYQSRQKSNITAEFTQKLNRVLVDPAIPIQVREARDRYERGGGTNTIGGIFRRLEQPRVKRHIEHDGRPEWDFGRPFGKRKFRVVVFKDTPTINDDESLSKGTKDRFVGGDKHRKQAVFYLVNGQSHAHETRRFITGKEGCQLPHTGKDMMVFVDLSDFADKNEHDLADFVDLFSASRDRLGGTEIAEQLKDELISAIKNYEPVQELEERRRTRVARQRQDEQITDILQSLYDRVPPIRRYFDIGDRLEAPGRKKTGAKEYEAPFFPTEFKIIKKITGGEPKFWDESKGLYVNRQAANRESRMKFYLNAPNDYFDRDDRPGELEVEPESIVKQSSLHNGILRLMLQPLPGVEEGSKFNIQVRITRAANEPLTQEFRVEYVEPAPEPEEKQSSPESPPKKDKPDLPEPIPVYRESDDPADTTWDDMDPEWNEDDIVELMDNGDGIKDIDVFVNMDAAPYESFIHRHNLTDVGKERVTEYWKVGILVYSLSEYIELEDAYKQNGVVPEDIVPITIRGISQSMLDQHISSDELDSMTV